MNEQREPDTSNTQSAKKDVEASANRSFLYHIGDVSKRLSRFFHSLAIYLKPDPAKNGESPPPVQEAATGKWRRVKEPFLYRLKYAAHERFPRIFDYPVRLGEQAISQIFDPKENAETCPPDDEFIDLCCMWAVEFYTPAHIDTLLAGFRKLGWDKNHSNSRSPTSWIQKLRQSPRGSGWLDLGVIYPQGTDNNPWSSRCLTAPLPPHVQHATGGLFSLTSSLTCIVIGFVFEEDFSTQFDKTLRTDRQTYEKSVGRGYTRKFRPKMQKADHIWQIRADIAELAARWFRENLPGLFSSGILEDNLPTCELVTLQKAEPFPIRSKDNTDPSAYHYLSILDMHSTFNAWRSENTLGLKFTDSQTRDRGPRYHSILAIRESDIKKEIAIRESNLKKNLATKENINVQIASDNRSGRIRYIDKQIQHLLSRWAIFPLLVGYGQHLNAIRDSFRPKSRQKSVKILQTLSDHVSYIDIAAVTADLISYTQQPSSFSFDLGTFKPCDEHRYEADYTLDKALCSAIEERAIWLQKTDQSLRDHLTQYGSLLGAKENVRLQRTIRFLTWVILILTLLTVVLSWSELQKLWSVISQWLRNFW